MRLALPAVEIRYGAVVLQCCGSGSRGREAHGFSGTVEY